MDPMFQTHLLNPEGVAQAKAIAEAFDGLLKALPENGDGRCRAIVRTHLEQACFYAKKSIAVLPQFQLTPETP